MSVESRSNNCNSFEAFKPVFNDGLCTLISNASLNSNSFELYALSRIVLLIIYLMFNF